METIISGSELNHRTFDDNESWSSILMESKNLAGNVCDTTENGNNQLKDNLSTVVEESSKFSESEFDDDNELNMNIGALSDDEVFFDCYTSPSPIKEISSPLRYKNLHPSYVERQSATQYLTINMAISLQNGETMYEGDKTGSMLAQFCEDFNNMKDQAQSTPKISSDTGFESSVTLESTYSTSHKDASTSADEPCSCKKRLDFHDAETLKISEKTKKESLINNSNKENYFDGKYSVNPSLMKEKVPQSKMKAPAKIPIKRVSQLKELYESRARLYEEQSRVNITKPPVRKSTRAEKSTTQNKSIKNSLTKSRTLISPADKSSKTNTSENVKSIRKSPSYQTRRARIAIRTVKNIKFSPKTRSGYNSSAGSSFLLKNQPDLTDSYLRPSSCSEFPSEISSPCLQRNRSKSTSDLSIETSDKTNLEYAIKMNRIVQRSYGFNQRSTLHKNSPKKVSTIANRKSLVQLILKKTPPKPVSEIRKVFTPSSNATKIGVPGKNVSKIPRIVMNK